MNEIDDDLVSAGREACIRAFQVYTTPGSSTLSYFAGQKRPKKHRAKITTALQPAPGGPSGGVLTDEQRDRIARHRIGEDELHASATRNPGFSRPPLPDNQRLAGDVHRAIAELPSMELLWINFCYRKPGGARTDYGLKFQREYFDRYQAEHLANAKTRTRSTIHDLLGVAMANEAEPNRHIYPDVPRSARRGWNKTYGPHYFAIQVALHNIHRQALSKVAEKLTETEN